MPLAINLQLTASKLLPSINRLFELSARKILALEKSWDPRKGTPVFTRRGRFTSRGWTEWTQGFQFGSALLQYDATGEKRFLDIGRTNTHRYMASHVSHMGVHDHGFNNVSTYGNLWRLMREGRVPHNETEQWGYELALKVSGAVQAARWTTIAAGPRPSALPNPSTINHQPSTNRGYIYSFNGPHSLFIDTMRSLRSLAVAHQLGHVLMGEHDERISLLGRLLQHSQTTAARAIYYGEGRDAFDVRGRTAHESIFNTNDGQYRCPNSQQGYSGFSTWTRGLAWAICGFAEQLEFLATVKTKEAAQGIAVMLKAATATADYYIEIACRDGVPVWDTGAPNLHKLRDFQEKPSDPYNPWEPVDSSAAAIAAQGLLRLGNYLSSSSKTSSETSPPRDARLGKRYRQAGITIASTLFSEPYLSLKPNHQGLLLHSVYHRPNAWDHIPPGEKVPNGESSMWGDYHARELALMLSREAKGEPYLRFFAGV